MGALVVITEPSSEPITLEDAKEALRIDSNYEDGRIANLIIAARRWAEGFTGQYLITQIVERQFDCFKDESINLGIWPLQSIDSVKYDSSSSPSETTFTDYYADIKTKGGRIEEINGWPSPVEKPNAVRVRCTAGYLNANKVPEIIKAAIKAYVIYLYDANQDYKDIAESTLWQERISYPH